MLTAVLDLKLFASWIRIRNSELQIQIPTTGIFQRSKEDHAMWTTIPIVA
jgi:hypothetical protein